MSPLWLGLGVAALTALLWGIGALTPWLPSESALDLHWYFLATYEAFFGALRAGTPILWNPYQLCGMPWLGTLEGGFFYPPDVLYVLFPTRWALALSTAFHLTLAAGGTAAFARRAGLSAAAATLAAAVFTFAGYLRGTQLWPYLFEASTWLPFGALAILDLTGAGQRRGTIILALASGMSWLAGGPQATVFACYAWGALFAARLLAARPPITDLARAVGGLVVGVVAGALLAAVALLPGFELAREGVRRTSTLDIQSMYPFGAPTPSGVWNVWLGTGPHILLLAALGLVPWTLLSPSRALVLWGLVLVGCAATFALGPATPLFRLYLLLPFLGWFRVPHRVLIVGQLALGILAGLGLDAATQRLRLRWLVPVVLLVLVIAATLEGLAKPHALPLVPDRSQWDSPAHRGAYSGLAATIGDLRVWPFSPGLGKYSLPPKLPTLTRLRSISDYELLSLRRQHEYFVFLSEGILRAPRGSESSVVSSLSAPPGQQPPATRRRLLDLAGVRFMIVPPATKKRPDVAAFVRDARLDARPPIGEALEIYENPHVLPRAFVTYRASSAPPTPELLAILAQESFDPLAESWVEGNASLPSPANAPSRGSAVTIVRDDPQVVEIEAALVAPGLVVLADTFYSGWTATVDGAPVPILATNHLFRGVPAPAGKHRIRFTYRPWSLALGAALSALTLLALGAAAQRTRCRSRSSSRR